MPLQVLNSLHMGWVEYCAALATARRMAADMDGRTLVVHNGDVSYAEGFVYGWDVFMHMMAPIIQRAPYMLTPGKRLQIAPASLRVGRPMSNAKHISMRPFRFLVLIVSEFCRCRPVVRSCS